MKLGLRLTLMALPVAACLLMAKGAASVTLFAAHAQSAGASVPVHNTKRSLPAAWLAAAPATDQSAKGKTESGHQDIFDWVNFILLVVVLIYVLRKPVGRFFENRSAALRHDLEEGRKALEEARIELARAEEKLSRLEAEIAALKASAAQDREAEISRMKQASEQEGKRILESARNMIESATQAARLELKRTAANEALVLAETMIRERLDSAARSRLVDQFLKEVR